MIISLISTGFLKSMLDSGYVKAADYESYFSNLYFDAKIEMKKQQNKDEKRLEMDDDNEDAGDNIDDDYKMFYKKSNSNSSVSPLQEYAVLLMPFYDKYPSGSEVV